MRLAREEDPLLHWEDVQRGLVRLAKTHPDGKEIHWDRVHVTLDHPRDEATVAITFHHRKRPGSYKITVAETRLGLFLHADPGAWMARRAWREVVKWLGEEEEKKVDVAPPLEFERDERLFGEYDPIAGF